MADEEGYLLNEQTIRRLAKVVAQVLGKSHRQRDDRPYPRDSGPVNWQPFVNDSSETIPANAVVRLSNSTFDSLQDATGGAVISRVYHAVKPDTTFGRYAINSSLQVAAGESGFLCLEGPCEQAFESGTVTIGGGYGPKPGQWTLSKGYPATTIADGTTNSESKRLFGSFNQITTALIRFTGSVSNNTSTTAYKIYAGTMGSESDAGFTTVPSARNRTGARVNNDWAVLQRINNGWEIVNLEDAASDAEIFRTTLGSGVSDGGTVSVTSPVAGSVTAHNEVNGAALSSGDKVTVYKDKGDATYQLIKTQAGTAAEIYNITIPVPGVASLASISVTIPSGTVSATNWSDTTMNAEDYAHVYKNPDDGLYYLFKTGGSSQSYGIIEGGVAANFAKTSYGFLANVIHDDDGNLSANTLVFVWNPYDPKTGTYVFEGEHNAACQFRYSPNGQIYRAIWVACPDDTVQVGVGGEGSQSINLGSYGYGGQPDIVSNVYFGEV